MKRIYKIISACLAVMLLASLLPLSCCALQKVNLQAECSLTLCYKHGEKLLGGADFLLYRVADVNDNMQFIVNNTFSAYPVDFDDMNEDRWAILANTLQGYAQKDSLSPDARKTTDKNGIAVFNNLGTGLYLVLGSRIEDGTKVYSPVPFFVCLPYGEYNLGNWDYNPTSYPKTMVEKINGGEKFALRVLKKWNDSGMEEKRPKSVGVQLLRDGKVFDKAVLSAQNDWTYEWNYLDKNFSWNVVEVPTENYTVEQTKAGDTICLTNTYKGKVPEKAEEKDPLPKTGLLWWPVPVLFFAGILLVALSVIVRRKHEE